MAEVKAKTKPKSMAKNTAKYLSYRLAFKRINAAIKSTFPLEAITVAESIICDRLLSFVIAYEPTKVDIDTDFSDLIDKAIKYDKQNNKNNINNEVFLRSLHKWRKDRNHALHEIAKSLPGKSPRIPANTFIKDTLVLAEEGKRLARGVVDWHRKEVAKQKTMLPNSTPTPSPKVSSPSTPSTTTTSQTTATAKKKEPWWIKRRNRKKNKA